MKRALVFGVLGFSLLRVTAQVTLEVELDQDQYLAGEPMVATVRLTNRAGQSIQLGTEPDWLTFSIEAKDGGAVRQLDFVPVADNFKLDSSKRATKRVDIAPYFEMNRQGHYALRATVNLKAWKQNLTSEPRSFDIINGTSLWETTVGLPLKGDGTNAPLDTRRYMLQQARYLHSQLRLYLRVMDAVSGKVYRVVPIGQMVSFSEPEPLVDRESKLHVLYQNGPRAYSYTVFSPDGELLTRETYDWTGPSRPKLKTDADGKVTVANGLKRPTDSEAAAAATKPPEPLPAGKP